MRTQTNIDSDSIAAMLPDGRLVPLGYHGDEDGSRGIHAGTGEGREVYRRGLILALDAAVKRVFPDAVLWVEHSISLGYRCRLENRPDIGGERLVEILAEALGKVISEALPIESVEYCSTGSRLELPDDFLKLARWSDCERPLNCNLLGESCAFAMGPAVIDTSWLSRWELRPQGRDFVLRFPGSGSWPEIGRWRPRSKLAAEFDLEEKHGSRMRVQNFDQLNGRIEEDGGRQVVLMSHFYQTYRMVEMVKELEEAFPEKRIITIAGPSSSGKTTFAGLLKTYLLAQGFGAQVINVDNYFHNRFQTPVGSDGKPDFESLDAINTELFGRHLSTLLTQGEVKTPVFDFKSGVRMDDVETLKLGPSDFLLVEGIHGLNDALTPGVEPSQKFRIYASALTQMNIDRLTRVSTTDSRLVRRMVRDDTQRGYTAEETILGWPSVRRGERMNIFAFQEEADAMFNSSLPYELPVLKSYAVPLLRTVPAGSPAYNTASRLLDMFSCLHPIEQELVPITSLLREFIGGSIFERGE